MFRIFNGFNNLDEFFQNLRLNSNLNLNYKYGVLNYHILIIFILF